MRVIDISVLHGDALKFGADVLVLKFAQQAYGLDKRVIDLLSQSDGGISAKLPKIGETFYIDGKNVTKTDGILFLGVPPLLDFGYKEIRLFGNRMLAVLKESHQRITSIITTIHGAGYGLDEIEAFRSQVAGILESINDKQYPEDLSKIIFVEISEGRTQRLREILSDLFPSGNIALPDEYISDISAQKQPATILSLAGPDSEDKKRVFVAMPFATDFDDSFHYGIQATVKSFGYACERADLESFTGDVMDWVKDRISFADFVIADLTTANPNVYLEVGYAWGKNKKTILLIKDTSELKFDTRGQRCLNYCNIRDLEEKLKKEIQGIRKD
jgi:hypothetical protein